MSSLEARVGALEEGTRVLASSHQHNVQVMKVGFGINDAHVTVLQMISHDLVSDWVRMKPMVHEEIEFYASRREQGLPDVDWYDWLQENNMAPLRMRGQSLDLEWYHEKFNTISRFLAFLLWMGKVTGINEGNKNA